LLGDCLVIPIKDREIRKNQKAYKHRLSESASEGEGEPEREKSASLHMMLKACCGGKYG
jgi:hypothetical protein